MPQISVAPTRTNLIRLKKDLRFAKEGYEILDRKREALTGELVRVAKEADQVQKEVWALLQTATPWALLGRVFLLSTVLTWLLVLIGRLPKRDEHNPWGRRAVQACG